jgi:hypothetical protein
MKSHSLLLTFAFAALTACSADPTMDDTTTDFDTSDTQEQRAASWERLVGSWEAMGTGSNQYAQIVFGRSSENDGHHYFGMRNVTCIRAPCPAIREDGSFTAGSALLTLRANGGIQRLRYTLSGDHLNILSGERVISRMRRTDSYCGTPADCRDQGLIGVRCPGVWTCAATLCAYQCGRVDPCAGFRCPTGQHCSAPADAPMCVADERAPTCATTRCILGTRCEMTADGRARCVSLTNPCDLVRCTSGTHCVSSGSTAACVADLGGYGATCGGIAGLRCGVGYTCVMTSMTPDASGFCHAQSGVGGPCGGGSIRFPAVCASGLRCVGPATGAPIGATGTCTR